MVTAELSLYPLTDNYESAVIGFIKSLKNNPNVEVLTHAMSTFVKGESSAVFNAIQNAVDSTYDECTFSLTMKLINRNLPVESGFLEFE